MAKFAAEIEGTIEDVRPDGADGALMVVMGMTVQITGAAFRNHRVRTPTKNKTVTRDQLANNAWLPGRQNVAEKAGFKGGTAIVAGNYDPTADRIVVDFDPAPDPGQDPAVVPFEAHPSVEVGPPENVLLGRLTGNAAMGTLAVNGVPVRRLGFDFPADDRLVGEPMQNEFGFDIDPTTIPPDVLASVDGYLSDSIQVNGKFAFIGYNFVVDSTAPKPLIKDRPQVSILRAQATNEESQYSLDIRGGITTPAGQPIGARPTLTLSGKALGATAWETIDDRVAGVRQLTPGNFARWRLNIVKPGSAPEMVRVSINGVPGPIVSSEEFVDIREG